MLASVSYYRKYTEGFLAALLSFYPRPSYRLVGKDGSILDETPASNGINFNSIERL